MNEKQSLKENTRHGTSGQPVAAIHFTTGAGTFYPDHFFVERHWHYPVEILKITKGTFTVEINLETYTLHAGDICFINSEELHRLEGLDPVTVHDAVIFHPHILEFSYPDEFQEQYAAPFLSHASSLPRLLTPEDPLYPVIGWPLWQRREKTDGISGSNFLYWKCFMNFAYTKKCPPQRNFSARQAKNGSAVTKKSYLILKKTI